MRALAAAGIERAYLACSYKSMDVVKALGDGRYLGLELVYAFEEVPMGTAGAVKLIEEKLDGTFVVAMGDTLMDIDFEHIIRSHERNKATVTIALTEVDNPIEFGIVGLDDKDRIVRFKEKPQAEEAFSKLINAGVYVIEKEVFQYVPPDTKFDFSKNLFPKLLEAGKPLYGSRLEGMWKDIGRPRDLLEANLAMAERRGVERRIPGITTKGKIVSGRFEGKGAILNGPIFLGENIKMDKDVTISSSAIGQGSRIEAEVRIQNSLLLDSCTILKGTTINGSIIGDGCKIGPGVTLNDCIIGDGVVMEGPSRLEGKTLE